MSEQKSEDKALLSQLHALVREPQAGRGKLFWKQKFLTSILSFLSDYSH